MRFMMMVKTPESAGPPTPELQAAVGRLMGEMAQAGVLLDAAGLLPSARGALLKLSGAKVTATDGPFVETKEVIGGFAILRADSREAAIELGRRFLQVHADAAGPSFDASLEIREMSEPAAGRAG